MDKSFTLPGLPIDGPEVVIEYGSFTLASRHLGKWVAVTNSTGVTVTIPPGWALSTGSSCVIEQNGAGQITFAAGTGVTMQARGFTATIKTNAQWAPATLVYKGSNNWNISGDITAT